MEGVAITRQRREPAFITPAQVVEARRELGRQLARWRKAAGLTQAEFAGRMCYSRSTVANVERGRQNVPRVFWQNADRELRAGGVLLAGFDQTDALVRSYWSQMAQVADQERGQRFTRRPAHGAVTPVRVAPMVKPLRGAEGEPDGCGCAVAVGRWSGRETLALREAMRLSMRAFAGYLGVAIATVGNWEDRRRSVMPGLAMQAVLDDALKLTNADVRTRFRLILQSQAGGSQPADTADSQEAP